MPSKIANDQHARLDKNKMFLISVQLLFLILVQNFGLSGVILYL